MNELYQHMTKIEDRNGTELYFGSFHAPSFLICWKHLGNKCGVNEAQLRKMHVRDFEPETLQYINVWENLNKEIKVEVENFKQLHAQREEARKAERIEKMEHARKHRRAKYPDIPSEITCVTCGNTVKQSPSITAAITRRKNILVVDYIKNFECAECCPRVRGRAVDPKYAHLPRKIELTCSCKDVHKYPRSAIIQILKKQGISFEDYCKAYRCRKCKPVNRGKAARWASNEENPYKIQCKVCKEWKGTNPDQVAKIAKKLKMTSEKVYEEYVCRSCNAKLPKGQKFIKRKKRNKKHKK